jgi:membrane-associated protease RseP (regulator of RpoE activity)
MLNNALSIAQTPLCSFLLRTAVVCGSVLCGMTSLTQAQTHWPSRIPTQAEELLDTDLLRAQVLGHWGLPPGLALTTDHARGGACTRDRFNALGFVSIALPNYLRSPALALPDEAGQMITRVAPGSPAERSGLKPGMTIVELDRELVGSTVDLGRLGDSHTLLVLTDEGMQLVELESIAHSLLDATSALDTEHPLDLGLMPKWLGSPLNNGSAPRSLSISESNGIMAIAAIVDTAHGAQRVELKGNRQQVEGQLQQLSPEVQAVLRPHLR